MPSCRQEDGDLLLACLSGKMAGQSGGRMKTKIDATDVRIVEELRKNARITMKELGARVFLTGQAVRNRVERLEDMGILQRYTINVNCPVFGYKVHAVIRVQLRHGPVEALKACCRKGGRRTIHCYRTTGDNLYFLDMTEYLTVKDEYARSRPVVAIILIDNYDELTGNLSDNDVSGINVALNNAIRRWTEGTGGLLRKIERNRYLFIFESQVLPGMIENKFFLLDDIRQVVNGSGVAATVSLGIGKDGASYEEAYNFAALSIEMALSRGGDQAVVKDRYNFNFYGARAKESSSRTKVKSRVMAGSLSELIAQSSHIFIMGHSNADLDALGAAAGVQAICRKRGKKANIIVDYQQNAVQEMLTRLSALPEYKDCFLSGESALIMADAKSLLIVVDTNRPDQVEYRPLLNSMNRVVVIDHHRRAADYIEQVVLNHHEPSASSASELVAELLQYAVDPGDVLPTEAMALMAGIVLDTKHFSVRTSGRTFEAAAFLERLGADTVDVKKLLQSDFSTTVARYQIVQKARIYRNEIAISVLDSEVSRVTAAQASDELVNISNISASFVLYPAKDKIMISARSIGDANVQVILEFLGGGGNPATAGAQIAGADMGTVVDRLIASIDHFYEEMSEKPTTTN